MIKCYRKFEEEYRSTYLDFFIVINASLTLVCCPPDNSHNGLVANSPLIPAVAKTLLNSPSVLR